ncbi:hypothetical protein VRK_01670 [Vibrio sp. MEBiC08052]|nr:hypothetical protein VRK_01670 [Vibrio sp. MEBiC08052]
MFVVSFIVAALIDYASIIEYVMAGVNPNVTLPVIPGDDMIDVE